ANHTSTLAFTVSVAASGQVTQAQQRAIVHDDPADPVESGASAAKLAAADLITLTATAKDGDGDTKSATANIGDHFTFEDDGPSATAGGTVPTLVTDDTDITDTDTKGFAGVFTVGYGQDGPLDANHDGTADAGALTYALGVKSAGVDSGLDDTL